MNRKPLSILPFVLLFLLCIYSVSGADVLEIPADVEIIEQEAFYGDALDKVILPDGVKTIGSKAFANSGLKRINLPASLISIAEDAFDENVIVSAAAGTYAAGWAKTHSVMTESPVEWFEFSDNEDGTCTLDKYVGPNVSSDNMVIPERNADGKIVSAIGASAFNITDGNNNSLLTGLTGRLIIPDSVVSIGWYAFYQCSGFRGDLIIPDSVTSIDERAFAECWGLSGRLVLPERMTYVGRQAFYGCSFTGDLIIPKGLTEINEAAFGEAGFTGDLILPEGVTKIWTIAFGECGFTGDLILPESIIYIDDFPFPYNYQFQRVLAVKDSYSWNWCVENGLGDILVEINDGNG